MIEVNVTNLRCNIAVLTEILNNLAEVQINLFNQLKNSCIDWQDGHSIEFDDRIFLDHQETDDVYVTLNQRIAIYDLVCARYSEIGQKIKCDLDGKDILLSAIQECVDLVESAINDLASVKVDVGDASSSLYKAKGTLEGYHDGCEETFEKIECFEEEIGEKTNEIETKDISDFDYDIDINVSKKG